MPTTPDFAHPELQLGMVNPPRKVKRLRELAFRDSPGESSVPITNLHVSPSPASRAPTPPASTATPRRRGRKPAGPLSKSAREQLRKTNHSVIEKRRREKINEALAALRELVPNDKPEGEKKEDKEFKLEILVRTVEYLRIMVAKVKNLEGGMCQKCGGALFATTTPSKPLPNTRDCPESVKRKRAEYEDENAGDGLDCESEDLGAVFLAPARAQPMNPCSSSPTDLQPRPRLPSIASWMVDFPIETPLANSHAFQLPSPPQTAPFAPTMTSTGFLPGLVLPSPIGPGFRSSARPRGSTHQGSPPSERASPSFVSLSPRDRDVPELPLDGTAQSLPRRDSSKHSQVPSSFRSNQTLTIVPTVTPSKGDRLSGSPVSPWSRDDQTAASLLLNISSRCSRSDSDEGRPQDHRLSRSRARRGVVLAAQTPSSVLGMAESPGGESSQG